MAYFITFTCYGTRLHGDDKGSVDREHCAPGTAYAEASAARMKYERSRMGADPCLLGPEERFVVLKMIQNVCVRCGYTLNAAHVRTNHVHVVVAGDDDPEDVMGRMKGRASFELNRLSGRSKKRWSRHGSTRYLWTEEEVVDTVNYVLFGQGETMATYPHDLEVR
ncbi:MAG: transposase [Acidobacteria bacterium]|nr:transposase [Acidobacteriota bacterium]MDA1235942.1 transposase [Acidobacteriota bacterium]